jgi:hypothetical protein
MKQEGSSIYFGDIFRLLIVQFKIQAHLVTKQAKYDFFLIAISELDALTKQVIYSGDKVKSNLNFSLTANIVRGLKDYINELSPV